jgi:endonuclease YncB( thermonuclease family)
MRIVSTTTVLLLAGLLAAPAIAQVESDRTFTGTVVGVVDGDTYTVWRSAGDTVAVHLWGVDAPEPGQTYGAAATRAVRNYVEGKSTRVSVALVDPQGRVVGRVEVRGRSLSKMLLRRGLGWHYELHAPNDTTLERLEREARATERGLWSQPAPVPPWEWTDRGADEGGADGADRGSASPVLRPQCSRRTQLCPGRRWSPAGNRGG